MAIPHDDVLQHEILELLASTDGGRMLSTKVYNVLAESHPELTNVERNVKYRNSLSQWANRVQFARLHLVNKGFLFRAGEGPDSERGVWIITDAGRDYHSQFIRRLRQ